jgi:hypothetical protein
MRLKSIPFIYRQVVRFPWPQFLTDCLNKREFVWAWKTVRPFSMVPYPRLRSLYYGVMDVTARGIPGDVVECGTARGGSAALMALALTQFAPNRRLWVFDTFEGIPAATSDDPDYEIAKTFTGNFRGELDEVKSLFQKLRIQEMARLVKGRFQDTLPRTDTGPISLLHLDGDWYESTKCCLDYLYDKVSPGGLIQIDDWGYWAGARKATAEFLDARAIETPLIYIDESGRKLIKSSN